MSLAAGSHLGPYQIVGPLGAGGMGEVYQARDTRLDRLVAIKVLPPHVAVDPERRSRFEREARAIAKLSHANILAIHDVGEADGVRFIVTELVEGEPVRGPLPVRKLLDVGAQIADGLAAAHEAGLVHRDVKPDNILVTRDGRVKILDFGLAREDPRAGDGSGVTQTVTSAGTVLGTVAYMSPEQARALSADARSDQFSLGLVLYELASGRQAFVRDSAAQTLAAIIETEPDVEPLAALPTPLRWIIERCLAKDPAERYASTADLYRDLRHLRERQSELGQSGVGELTAGPSRYRRFWPVPVGALLLVLAAATFWPRGAAPITYDDYRFVPFAVEPGVQSMPAWSPDGESLAFAGEVDGYTQIFVRRLDQPNASQITDLEGDCTYPVWDTRGTRVFFVLARSDLSSFLGADSEVWVVSAAGGAPERLIEGAFAFAVAPNGETLVFAEPHEGSFSDSFSSYQLRSYDLATGEASDLPQSVPRSASWPLSTRSLAFSPDGSQLGFVVPSTSELVILSNPLSGGGEPRPVTFMSASGEPLSLYELDWMPDSRHVLLSVLDGFGGDRSIWRGDVETGRASRLTASTSWEFSPVASPDGRRLAFTSSALDWDVMQVDRVTQEHGPLVASSRYDGWGDWLPDGSGFIFTTQRNGRFEIWEQSSQGGEAVPIVTPEAFTDGATHFLSSGSVSPDGRSVAYLRYAPGEVRVHVSARAGSRPVRLTNDGEGMVREESPAWSPDGRWIFFRRGRQLMKALASGGTTPIALAEDAATDFSARPRVTPDGRSVVYLATDGFRQVDVDGGTARHISEVLPALWDLSSDGRRILAIFQGERRDIELKSIEVATGDLQHILSLGKAPVTPDFNGWYDTLRALRISPDGTRLMYSYLNPQADIWILNGVGIERR